jgi:hypothetical protein
MSYNHKTQLVKVGNRAAQIDCKIALLIEGLWKLDIDTCLSCENNVPENWIWIDFATANDAENFLNIVSTYSENSNSMYQRIVGVWDNIKDTWQYKTNIDNFGVESDIDEDDYVVEEFAGKHCFNFSLSIRFPNKDLKAVTKKILSETNKIGKNDEQKDIPLLANSG